MNSIKNLFNELFSWGNHASYSSGTAIEWLAGLVLILILAFLWKSVTDSIE